MGPKRGVSNQSGAASNRGKGRGPPPPNQGQIGILVQDLLHDEDYNRYIKKFQ